MPLSRIVRLVDPRQRAEILISPPVERIVNRKILEWSECCGTYGQGGPGFFGLKLEATGDYPEEWFMLRLWGASNWLSVNDRWLAARPDQYKDGQKPLVSGFEERWDEFKPLVVGKTIDAFEVEERSLRITIGDTVVQLTDDPSRRPVFAGTGEPRVLSEGDDLRQAVLLAPWPWVCV